MSGPAVDRLALLRLRIVDAAGTAETTWPPWLRRHCIKAAWLVLSVGTLQALDQNQKPEVASGEARGGGGLGRHLKR